MFKQHRWPREAWLPFLAGLVWLWYAYSFGVIGFLFAIIPGCMLLSSGFATLVYPGDNRIPQFVALGGLMGVVLAIPPLFLGSPLAGLMLILLSAMSFLSAGFIALAQEPHTDDVPEPRRSLGLAAEIANDDTVLAILVLGAPMFVDKDHTRISREVHDARELFQNRGWLKQPVDFHPKPPPLTDVTLRKRRSGSLEFEHVSFASGYEPHPGEPGRERWLDRAPNRTGHAWVLRHADPSRPWLVCIHGYGMGRAHIDLRAFRAMRLHHQLGLNLIMPILPFHGPRKVWRWDGQGFISGEFLDSIHAEAQAMWDIRRLLSWLRTQGGERIGVFGVSLGGYNAALLACLEDGLDCVIPGIPAADLTRLKWRHGPPLHVRYAERQGLVHDEVSEVLRVVSPLALPPRVAKHRRYIFAAVSDRLAPAEQARDLWRHWDKPRILWYQGGHLGFNLHPAVGAFVDEALHASGLVNTGRDRALVSN